MNIPELITQGETRVWKDGNLVDDLNAALTPPAWTLTYALRGAAAVNLAALSVNNISIAPA